MAFIFGMLRFPAEPMALVKDAERGVLQSLADTAGHGATLLHGTGITPFACLSPEVVQRDGKAGMLCLHRMHQRVDLNGATFEQFGPDQQVLALVVCVKERHHPLDVIRDDRHPGTGSRRDSADQTGKGAELSPEHLVDHEHVPAVSHDGALHHWAFSG